MKRKILILGLFLLSGFVYGRQFDVEINNFAFSPSLLTINVGDTVKWTNKDNVAHTVTANGGAFNSGILSTNSVFLMKFTASGSFDYHCTIHPDMIARIVVVGSVNSITDLTQPKEYILYQNYPNPFNPVTKIPFYLSKGSGIRLTVYSIIGKEIVNQKVEYLASGYHEMAFDGTNLPSGVYIYKISAGDRSEFVANRRMILTK
jgi:hypothetical protein